MKRPQWLTRRRVLIGSGLAISLAVAIDLGYKFSFTGFGVDEKVITRENLDGKNAPLLCNTALPQGIGINPDRDCDRLSQILLQRSPWKFKALEDAKAYIDEARQKKWD